MQILIPGVQHREKSNTLYAVYLKERKLKLNRPRLVYIASKQGEESVAVTIRKGPMTLDVLRERYLKGKKFESHAVSGPRRIKTASRSLPPRRHQPPVS